MLIGVPGSGKSTWVAKAPLDWSKTVVASTDNYIEREAEKLGKTYTEMFKALINSANDHMEQTLKFALASNLDIIWDQTNLTKNSRIKKLKEIPDTYKKIAVVFKTPDISELNRRLKNRQGKDIPKNILKNMIDSFQEPSEDEGFDKIIYV
jgi:predicted kinase